MNVFSEKKYLKSNDMCVICYDDLIENEFLLECNQCSKNFHHNCIDSWKNDRNNCPNCRYTIKKPDIVNNINYTNYRYGFHQPYHMFPIYLAYFVFCKFILILFLIILIIIYFNPFL